MFVTKKHLSRRTVLRGLGATVALPLLDAMIPGSHGARAHGGRADAEARLHLLSARRDHGASGRRQPKARASSSRRCSSRSRRSRASSRSSAASRTSTPRVRRTRSRRARGCRASAPRISHDPVRRRHGRPDRGAAHRPGHAAAVARGCDRGSRRRRRLRPQLRLQLRRDDLVPHAVARRCRWSSIRASCSSGCSARATRPRSASSWPRSTRASSTSSPTRPRRCRSSSGRSDRQHARRLSRERARDRAARAEDGGERPLAHRVARCAGRHSVELRRADEPDVRHRRARVDREPHAHHVVHDGGRGQQHDLQPRRGRRRVPRAVAPSEQRREARAPAARADLPLARVRALRAEAQGHAGRRRLDARSLAARLRQQHERQQRARSLPAADGARRRRLRQGEGRPAPALPGPHARVEPAVHRAQSRRRAASNRSATARASSRRSR